MLSWVGSGYREDDPLCGVGIPAWHLLLLDFMFFLPDLSGIHSICVGGCLDVWPSQEVLGAGLFSFSQGQEHVDGDPVVFSEKA